MNKVSDIVLIPIRGDLNVSNVNSIQQITDELIDRGCRRIILNMAECDYIDSCGMALIVRQTRRARKAGGILSLTNVSEQVYKILCIACLVDFIPVSLKKKIPVPVLDPSSRPLWKKTMRVEAERLEEARGKVTKTLTRLPMSPDDIFDMTLAGGEAMGNAVDHGRCKGVFVTLTGFSDRVIMEVTDCGCGFQLEDDEEPPERMDTCERGRGIKLMRLLVDSVSIRKKDSGEGTVVKLVKLIKPQKMC